MSRAVHKNSSSKIILTDKLGCKRFILETNEAAQWFVSNLAGAPAHPALMGSLCILTAHSGGFGGGRIKSDPHHWATMLQKLFYRWETCIQILAANSWQSWNRTLMQLHDSTGKSISVFRIWDSCWLEGRFAHESFTHFGNLLFLDTWWDLFEY